MADATRDFFDGLSRRGHDRRLRAIDEGSVRFDISRDGRTDHWLVAIEKGDITVVRRGDGHRRRRGRRGGPGVFDRIASGEAYFLTTVLRGEAAVAGSPRLFATVRKLFPPPPASADARRQGGSHG